MDLPKQLQEEPVVFNKEAGSYFMVRYDARSLCKLAKLLRENHTRMSVVERAQLQEDVAPLAMPNPSCKPCGIAGWVHMQEYLKKERDYIPWRTALDHLERLKGMLEGTLVEFWVVETEDLDSVLGAIWNCGEFYLGTEA